ncbi:hypothetical protein [Nocardiopsis kunsanensis]|uniref:Uncharacterized protein n=1 Tax=Nocardiopsis kunsanensis TaxID=141693 RepID=A0A918XEE2_9ACTN|nr:hypothetical protein [Nocardiopsis kunsanensis]GHD27053.1 hypothetical protein GCM10007147_25770 [Nocardiopsis kunsanensis]
MRAFSKITAATMLAGGMSVFGAGAAYAAPQEFDAPSVNDEPVSQEADEQFLEAQEGGEGAENPGPATEAPAEEAPAEEGTQAGNPLEQLPIAQEEAPAEEAPAEEGTQAGNPLEQLPIAQEEAPTEETPTEGADTDPAGQ